MPTDRLPPLAPFGRCPGSGVQGSQAMLFPDSYMLLHAPECSMHAVLHPGPDSKGGFHGPCSFQWVTTTALPGGFSRLHLKSSVPALQKLQARNHLHHHYINDVNTDSTSPCPAEVLCSVGSTVLPVECNSLIWNVVETGCRKDVDTTVPLLGQPESHFIYLIFLQPDISQK